MIGEIHKAVMEEAKAFFASIPEYAGATVILESDYKAANLLTYSMPLLLVDIVGSDDMSAYLGGVTRADWYFSFNSYNYQVDPLQDDITNWSGNLLNVVDELRRHFQNEMWIVPPSTGGDVPLSMADILSRYAFNFTLSGLHIAKHLEQDGLIKGWAIGFDSIALDMATNKIKDGPPLASIEPAPTYPWQE